MKRRDFDKLIRQCTTGGALDAMKVMDLTVPTRIEMVMDLVHARQPLPCCLIPSALSHAYLTDNGYTRYSRTIDGLVVHPEDKHGA